MIGIADQDAVLEKADLVVPEVELEKSVTQKRMVDGCTEFPGALGLQACIAAVHPLRGQIGNADEVVKIELRHRAPDRKQGMPPTCQPSSRRSGWASET